MPSTIDDAHVEPAPARAVGSPAGPACGRCGYCVRGIPGIVCPECGSDLREVGIVTANSRASMSTWGRAILWTLALPLPALAITWLLLVTVAPFSQMRKVMRVVFFQAPYLNKTIDAFGAERPWQPTILGPGRTVPGALRLYDQQSRIAMDVNLATGAYSYRDKNGTWVRKPGGLNGAAIADWLAAGGGVNANDPRVRQLCDSAYAALAEIPKGTAARFTPLLDPSGAQVGVAHPATAFTVHDEPHSAVIVAFGVLWLCVWLYGIRRIVRRATLPPSAARAG